MDSIYQGIVFERFHPAETVIILLLAFVPYVLLRGPVARIATLAARRRACQKRTVNHERPGKRANNPIVSLLTRRPTAILHGCALGLPSNAR